MTMSSATTMNVYGRLSASLTIHMTSSPYLGVNVVGSGGGRLGKAQGNQGHTAVQAEHLFDQIVVEFALVAVPSGAGQRGVDDSLAQRHRVAVDVQLSLFDFVGRVSVDHGTSLLAS